jgi:hypothetical protein
LSSGGSGEQDYQSGRRSPPHGFNISRAFN